MTVDDVTMNNARKAIFDAIDDLPDDEPEIGDVVHAATETEPPVAVFEAFAQVIRDGEVYTPRYGVVARTNMGQDE